MKTIKNLFRANKTTKDVKLIKKIYATLMLPVFLFQMTSINLLLLAPSPAFAAEEAAVSEIASIEEVTEEKVEENSKAESGESSEKKSESIEEKKEAVAVLPVAEQKDEQIIEKTVVASETLSDSTEKTSVEIWNVDGSKTVTNEKVQLGKTYIAPQNKEVSVTFTKLPEDPGMLSIEEITLSDEQIATLGAASNKAYDITSDMTDGTFEYDLTLPKPKNKENVQIKFAEDMAGLEKPETVPASEIEIKKDSVVATLDHFTVYIVVVGWNFPSNPDNNVSDEGLAMNSVKTLNVVGDTGSADYKTAGATTFSANAAGWNGGSGLKYWEMEFDTTGYNSLVLSSKQSSSSDGPRDFKIQYKIGGPSSIWTDLGTSVITDSTWTTGVVSSLALPAVLNNESSVSIRWIMTSNTAVNGLDVEALGTSSIDDIRVDGAAIPLPAPTIISLNKTAGTSNGGTGVVVLGTNFVNGAVVTIDGILVKNLIVGSDVLLSFSTPAGTLGAKDVVVTNPDGQSVTLVGGFTYIDTTPPTATFSYSTTNLTNGAVVATLNPSEPITVTNNGGSLSYTFNANGSFTFNFHDAAGNVSSATATVSNIDTEAPIVEINSPVSGDIVSGIVNVKGTVTDANPLRYYLVVKNSSNVKVSGPGTVNYATSFSDKSLLNWNTKLVPDGVYSIDLEARDAANNKDAGSISIKSVTVDNSAPIIVLNGDELIELQYGDAYNEQGAVWTDSTDGSGAAIVGGDIVDTSVLGEYHVTYSKTDSLGNVATQKTRTVTVVPRAITITADPQSKTYGDVDPALTYQITSGNLIGSDDFMGSLDRAIGEDVGIYAIEQGTVTLSTNYDLSYIGKNLKITKKELIVTADNKTKEYQAVDPIFTFGYAGFVSGEISTVINTEPTCAVSVLHEDLGEYPVVCSGGIDNNYSFAYANGSLKIVDTTIPQTFLAIEPTNPNGENNWYDSRPVVTLKATDNYLVNRIEYQLNSTSGDWTLYTAPFALENGQWTVYYRSVDSSSNVSVVGVKDARVDTSSPDNVDNLEAEYQSEFDGGRVRLTWDVNDSDIDQVYLYRGDNRNFSVNSSSRIAKNDKGDTSFSDYDVELGEKYYYKIVTVDNAGNKSDSRIISITLPVEEGGAAVVTNEGTEAVPEGTVLGEQTTNPEQANQESTEDQKANSTGGSVLGDQSVQETEQNKDSQTNWYWWLLVVILGGGSYLFWRNRKA